MKNIIIIIGLLTSSMVLGFRQVVIQTISKSKKTFITRNYQRDKIPVGTKANFVKGNIAYIAIAVESTREYVMWFVDNDLAQVAFRPGEIVTLHENPDFIWAHMPEEQFQEQIESNQATKRHWRHYKMGITRGLSQSNSEEESRREVTRSGLMFEFGIENYISPSIYFKYSGRYEREKVEYSSASVVSQMGLAKAEMMYYLPASEKFYDSRPYLSLGVGLGLTQIANTDRTIRGYTVLLPSVLGGLQLPLEDKRYHLVIEAGVEAQGTKAGSGDYAQTTDQVNGVINIGFSKIY